MKTPQAKINQIRQHSRQLVRELDVVKGVYLGTGYTFSQCHVLFELSAHKTLNLMELAEILLIDKSNTSRTVKQLVSLGLVKADKVNADNRQKLFSLTAKGEKALRETVHLADHQVRNAVDNLNGEQLETVISGIQLYATALQKSRLQQGYSIRPVRKRDNPNVARIIRDVMTEFQAIGEGYSTGDAEVEDMYGSYRNGRACFYVIHRHDQIVGCGGIAPLAGGDQFTCELRKMFFLPAIRGLGLGRRLLMQLMNDARQRGYRQCYLETLDRMWRANELYRKNGFELLTRPMGKTGHCSCDRWYLLKL